MQKMYLNRYSVSSCGSVFNTETGRELRGWKDTTGYNRFMLLAEAGKAVNVSAASIFKAIKRGTLYRGYVWSKK